MVFYQDKPTKTIWYESFNFRVIDNCDFGTEALEMMYPNLTFWKV